MDLVFRCPNCEQELAVEPSGAGTEITCPSCHNPITVPQTEHTAFLIKKPAPPLEAAKDGDKRLRIRTIKHGDCIEVGKDKFDEVVTAFLEKVGDAHVVSLTPLNYTHQDIATRQIVMDFAVLILYKG